MARKLTVDDFSKDTTGSSVRNFIAIDGEQLSGNFELNQPSLFEGISFSICMRGRAKVRFNSKIYEVNEHTIVTTMPNHIIEPLEKSDDFVLEILGFSLDFVADLPLGINAVQAIGRVPCLQINETDKQLLLNFHDLIIQLHSQKEYILRPEIAKALLYALSLQVGAIYQNADVEINRLKISRKEELTERFLRLLLEYYKVQRSPAFYAGKLCVTTKYLSQAVKDITGETVFEWINKVLIVSAKNMLKTSGLSVKQIAEELNFPNPSFFGRFFRQHTGITPLDYKKKSF